MVHEPPATDRNMSLLPSEWTEIFALETPLLELALRGVLLYLAILFLLRVMPRRTTGEVAAMDLVFILLITESASNALGDYASLGDGIVQILFVGLAALLVDLLNYRFRWFRKLTEAAPLKIIHDGKLIHRNLRREFITREELDSQLRANDVADIAEVQCAHVEAEGQITIVKKKR